MKKHLFVTLLLTCGMPFSGSMLALANPQPQEKVGDVAVAIKGTVVDEAGTPVIGASVVEKAKPSNGASTNIDGEFSVKVKPGTILRISYVGCKTVEVPAAPGMQVTLESHDALLDEVVIVGYGTQKKVNLTGAVSTVDIGKTMEGRPQMDVMKALQGAVPGLTITNSNGDINGQPSVSIRGVGSIIGTTNPLYVVDGVPMDDISYLNPEDIQNISVLKDAASSSIYGTRAAGGVILIQTRTAKKEDRVSIKYSNNFAWSSATYLPDYGSVPSQIKALSQANKRAGLANELFGMYLDNMLPYAEAWYEQNGGGKSGYREMRPFQSWDDVGDYYVNPDGSGAMYYADWDVKDIMFQAAPSQTHNVSIQGTTGKANYYVGFGYNEKEDIMEYNPSKLQRWNVNANFNVDLTDWLKAGVRFNFTNKTYDSPNLGRNTYTYMWRWGSYFGPYGYMKDAEGQIVDARNDIAYRKQAAKDHDVTTYTRINGYLQAQIIKGLTLNADMTYDVANRNNEYAYLPVYCWNTWGGNISSPSYAVGQSSTYARQSNTKDARWTGNVYATYEHTFNKDHNLKAMVGATADQRSYRYFWGQKKVLNDNNLPEIPLASGAQTTDASASHSATAGFFGRINYDYKGIYLLEVNGRYDASTSFPLNQQWGFFPSMSAGYRFSEEAYFEPIKDVVSNGKLRFSFGDIGNEALGDYRFLSVVESLSAGSTYWVGDGTTKISAYQMPTLVSSSLTWERVRTYDVGIDLGFLNNSLQVGFDWFQRETLDMLSPAVELPATVGASAPYGNEGSLRTRGWELSVNWNQRFGDFNVYVNANVSDYKTVVTEWNNPKGTLDDFFTGKEYGAIYGFETERYFTEDDFIGKNADGSWIYAPGVADQTGLQKGTFVYGPGDIKFKDQNGDGKINGGNGTKYDMGDLVKIGNNQPRYEYSFHVGGDWKGFDLDLYFQGVGKRDMWTTSAFVMPLMRGADATYLHMESYNEMIFDEAGNITGYIIDQSNKYPNMYPGNEGTGTVSGISAGSNNFYPQTRYLVDMSYLRLKNITFGYTLPQNLTRKAYIEKARLYFSADNIATLHRGNGDYPLDPEMNAGSGNSWGRTTPIAKTFSFGLQVTF